MYRMQLMSRYYSFNWCFDDLNCSFTIVCSWPQFVSLNYFLKMQVSDLINCGVYVFTPDVFNAIEDVSTHREGRGWSFSSHL